MKLFFWLFLISTLVLIISILIEIRNENIPKKAVFLLLPLILITVGCGYIYSLQLESKRNMKAIDAYFTTACKGYVMKPFEDPIEVNACGNNYLVHAKNGKLQIEVVANEFDWIITER